MNPSKFLRVPSASKPKSQIPVGRVSRVSAGKQYSGAKVPSNRSSSVNRASTLNPLQLFVNNGRSRSCTSLRGGSTPICRPSIIVTTPSSSCSKFSVNDKEWVNTQYSRVKAMLLELDQEMPALKPLDTKVYVRSMNLLWRQLDSRSAITDKNKDITAYLKLFKFPGQIKLSALKNPSIPHNFLYILTIWSWLVDIIELIRKPDKILEPPTANPIALKLYQLSLSYLTTKYQLFNVRNDDELHQPEKDLETQYTNIFMDGESIDLAETGEKEETLSKELSKQKEILNSTKQRKNELLNDVEQQKQSLDQSISDLEARKETNFTNKQEILLKMEHLQKKLKQRKELQSKLKVALKSQPCSLQQWDCMKDEKETLTYNIHLKKTRKDGKKEQLSKLDMDLCEEKHKVQIAIDNINTRITSEFQWRPELRELKIRETGFFQEDMIEIINQFIRNKKELDKKICTEQQRVKVALEDIQIHNEQHMMTEVHLTRKKDELEKEKQEVMKMLEHLQKTNEEVLKQRELKIKEYKEMITDAINETPDLQQLKDQEQRYTEKYKKLIEERNELMQVGMIFFINIFNITTNSMDAQMGYLNEIAQGVNEAQDSLYNKLLCMYENLKEQK